MVAKDRFITLLNEAERALWLCDDGNDFPDSIYNLPEVVHAVENRLRLNEQLRLFCLFSSADPTLFAKTFAEDPRVHMRRGHQPRRHIHFKIIDAGRKGYVSAHPQGSGERRYRSYDCSRAPGHIRQAALGRHLDSMTGLFSAEQAIA